MTSSYYYKTKTVGAPRDASLKKASEKFLEENVRIKKVPGQSSTVKLFQKAKQQSGGEVVAQEGVVQQKSIRPSKVKELNRPTLRVPKDTNVKVSQYIKAIEQAKKNKQKK